MLRFWCSSRRRWWRGGVRRRRWRRCAFGREGTAGTTGRWGVPLFLTNGVQHFRCAVPHHRHHLRRRHLHNEPRHACIRGHVSFVNFLTFLFGNDEECNDQVLWTCVHVDGGVKMEIWGEIYRGGIMKIYVRILCLPVH